MVEVVEETEHLLVTTEQVVVVEVVAGTPNLLTKLSLLVQVLLIRQEQKELLQVASIPHQKRMRFDDNCTVTVARRATEGPRLTLARESHAPIVVDHRGNRHFPLDLLLGEAGPGDGVVLQAALQRTREAVSYLRHGRLSLQPFVVRHVGQAFRANKLKHRWTHQQAEMQRWKRRLDGLAGQVRLQPRLDRHRQERPDSPARGNPGLIAGHAEHAGVPSGGRC